MKKIIIGNWKMNPQNLPEARKIFSALKRLAKDFKKTELVICPPFIYLSQLQTTNYGLRTIKLGAQDVFEENPPRGGAYTGQISATMLSNLNVEYVILGHSERRSLGETDEVVNRKIKTALSAGLKPVVCVGENQRDNDGKYLEILRAQIKNTFQRIKKTDIEKIIVAYEPVWAIGKDPKNYLNGASLFSMIIFIRKILAESYGKKTAFKISIIYGGSVSSFNVLDIFTEGKVSGILPGRASLDPKEMKEILQILETI